VLISHCSLSYYEYLELAGANGRRLLPRPVPTMNRNKLVSNLARILVDLAAYLSQLLRSKVQPHVETILAAPLNGLRAQSSILLLQQ
jgi:hypothetical protein